MADEKTTALDRKLEGLKRESEERTTKRLADELGFPYVDLGKTPISLEAIKLIPEAEAKEAKVAAIEVRVKKVALAVVEPKSPLVQRVVKSLEASGHAIKVFVASYSGIKQAWHLYGFVPPETSEITGKVGIEKQRFEEFTKRWSTLAAFQEEMRRVVREKETTTHLFEMILAEALATRASDIHFEAEEEKARIRFRIDGLLHDAMSDLSEKSYERLVSRIKLLSGMKINVRGEPQDGRFTLNLVNKDIEMRVSIIPSQFGETIVMRILDPDAINVSLAELGLREDDLKIVARQLEKPNGLVLNTGPTGSGKTTTLYAFLKHLSNPETKIITIEDPIEYKISGIEQTQVNPGVDYTFAKGLRAIVRQDPDVVLVGEIRDLETAEIAMQAALTGHVVFSTLHTNDAVGAVPRLFDLGVKPAIIGPALSLVIAQRLVRRLCEKCKQAAQVSTGDLTKYKKFLEKLAPRVDRRIFDSPAGFKIYKSVGCDVCHGFGYRGRVGVFEFLEAGSEFESAILKEISEVTLKKVAIKQRMVTMQEDGILKVFSGVTTFEEVAKVTGPIEW